MNIGHSTNKIWWTAYSLLSHILNKKDTRKLLRLGLKPGDKLEMDWRSK